MTTTLDVLGGAKALKEDVRGDLGLERLIRKGIPVTAFKFMAKRTQFSPAELERIISRRTIGRRERLTPEMSARLARFARAWALAEEAFGDRDTARGWFFESIPAFGGETPFHMLETESGARLVERELGRIAYGVYS